MTPTESKEDLKGNGSKPTTSRLVEEKDSVGALPKVQNQPSKPRIQAISVKSNPRIPSVENMGVLTSGSGLVGSPVESRGGHLRQAIFVDDNSSQHALSPAMRAVQNRRNKLRSEQ